MQAQALDSNSKAMPRHHKSFPRMKNGKGLSKMTIDSTPTKISWKSTIEGGLDFHEKTLGEGLTDKKVVDLRR